jgi:hypothetical protein
MRSADRPIKIEVNFFHALPNLSCKRSRHSSSSAVQGPSRRHGSRKFVHLSRHCLLFLVKPMPSDANSHAWPSLLTHLDTICRSCSSSFADHVPFFATLISGLKQLRHLWAHILLLRVPNWVLVAKHVKTRNNKMCAQRWRNCLRPEIKVAKKGTWSAEEDEQLRQIVSKCDCKDGHAWELASEGMGFTRNSKQCRERWTNFLDPCLRLGPWTAEEDECLLRLHDKFGNAWKKFTSILIGRSAERIRRHYTSLNRKKNRNVK